MEIDKSYWDDKSEIPASLKEKEANLNYELGKLKYCTKRFFELKDKETSDEKDLVIEGLALHSRVLIDFFYPELTRQIPTDVTANQFIENWDGIKPKLTQTLFDAREKAHKQLAHLTTWRLKIERDRRKGWSSLVSDDLEKVIKVFDSARATSGE
jgi:hypothetical protein